VRYSQFDRPLNSGLHGYKVIIVTLTANEIHRRHFPLCLEQWFCGCDQASDDAAGAGERERIHTSIASVFEDPNQEGRSTVGVGCPKRFANNLMQCSHGLDHSDPVQGEFIVRPHIPSDYMLSGRCWRDCIRIRTLNNLKGGGLRRSHRDYKRSLQRIYHHHKRRPSITSNHTPA
jgi:hypothetical protein